MSEINLNELKKNMLLLERQIKPLEYDASRNQIHDHKLTLLQKMKEEYGQLQEQFRVASSK